MEAEAWVNLSAPLKQNEAGDWVFDKCKRFDVDYLDDFVRPSNTSDLAVVECDQFEYDDSLFAVSKSHFGPRNYPLP